MKNKVCQIKYVTVVISMCRIYILSTFKVNGTIRSDLNKRIPNIQGLESGSGPKKLDRGIHKCYQFVQ